MEDDEKRAHDDSRFKETLRRPGYWSIPRVVATVLVVAAILAIALLI